MGVTLPRTSTIKRTVVHEDREQMLALMDHDESRSHTSSLNESSEVGFGFKAMTNSKKKLESSQ